MTRIIRDVVNVATLPNLLNETGHTMQRFTGEQVMYQLATTPKGSSFEPHQHHNEQLVFVLEGRIKLDIYDQGDTPRTVELGPGDMVHIPPNVPHGGETLEDARALDAFSPPRTGMMGESENDA